MPMSLILLISIFPELTKHAEGQIDVIPLFCQRVAV